MSSTAGKAWDEFEQMLRSAEAEAGTVAASFISAVPHSERAARIDQLVDFVRRGTAAQEEINAILKTAKSELAGMAPEMPGTHVLDGSKYRAEVSYSEKYEWDNEELIKMFSSGSLPHYCAMRLSIHKKSYERLSASEQAELAPALTIKLSAPKIDVGEK